jgi:hypothetical protein
MAYLTLFLAALLLRHLQGLGGLRRHGQHAVLIAFLDFGPTRKHWLRAVEIDA